MRYSPLLIFLFSSFFAFPQSQKNFPTITLNGLGGQTFVSKSKDSISIKGLENLVDIEFPNSKDSIYYQLMGYDEKQAKSAYPKIRYTNLVGGHYELKYRLASQPKYSIIKVNIEEAIWQKWWFFPMIFFYILLLIGIGMYFFFLYNFRQEMKVQQIRNKISSDLHDEVGSNLSSIAIYTQVLRKKLKSAEYDSILDKITSNSKESVTLMQDTVWAINPKNDTPEKLFSRIDSYAKGLLTSKNITYKQHVKIDFQKLILDMEDRKNLYLILKEGLNNIAKHAEASEAKLVVSSKNGEIEFVLTDNGNGFDLNQQSEGNGLKNFKDRAEESNFKLKIISIKDTGTEISVEVSP